MRCGQVSGRVSATELLPGGWELFAYSGSVSEGPHMKVTLRSCLQAQRHTQPPAPQQVSAPPAGSSPFPSPLPLWPCWTLLKQDVCLATPGTVTVDAWRASGTDPGAAQWVAGHFSAGGCQPSEQNARTAAPLEAGTQEELCLRKLLLQRNEHPTSSSALWGVRDRTPHLP